LKDRASGSPVCEAITVQVIGVQSFDSTGTPQSPRPDAVTSAFQADLQYALSQVQAAMLRARQFLVGGIGMVFLGVAVFCVSQSVGVENASDAVKVVHLIGRPIALLVFIEAIAWFMLRQYRETIDDYKLLHRVYLRRSNLFLAFLLSQDTPHGEITRNVVTALLNIDTLEERSHDQLNEGVDIQKRGEELIDLEKLGDVVAGVERIASSLARVQA
jgi:hypothetical protein